LFLKEKVSDKYLIAYLILTSDSVAGRSFI